MTLGSGISGYFLFVLHCPAKKSSEDAGAVLKGQPWEAVVVQ